MSATWFLSSGFMSSWGSLWVGFGGGGVVGVGLWGGSVGTSSWGRGGGFPDTSALLLTLARLSSLSGERVV